MKRLLAAIVIIGICTAPAFAKAKRVKAKPYTQCALWAPSGCATPVHYAVSPIVTAGDISVGIINSVTNPFR